MAYIFIKGELNFFQNPQNVLPKNYKANKNQETPGRILKGFFTVNSLNLRCWKVDVGYLPDKCVPARIIISYSLADHIS